MDPHETAPAGRGGFPATRHSVVDAVRSADRDERARGLSLLTAAYWRPVYKYVRLKFGKSHEEASDLTQELFLEILERELLARFDPSRARLRTYLRVCIDGLVANAAKAATRLKRGGGAVTLSLDLEGARAEVERAAGGARPSAGSSPEALFEAEWARSLFSLALERLRGELSEKGKGVHFEVLKRYDVEPELGGERPTYAALGAALGLSATDVTNRLSYARRELRRIVLDVLREMTSSEAEFRREARALLGVEA